MFFVEGEGGSNNNALSNPIGVAPSSEEMNFPSTENRSCRCERAHMSGVALEQGVGSKHVGAAAAETCLWGIAGLIS